MPRGYSHAAVEANRTMSAVRRDGWRGGRVLGPGRLELDMRGQGDLDRQIGRLAAFQHGVVAREQLRELGLSDKNIDYRIHVGRLVVVFRGVYGVGHARLSREGRWSSATLACGPKAVLSHADAAACWGLMPTRGTLAHVSTPLRGGRNPNPRRIVLHRVGTLQDGERTVNDGIPITTPARTLLDIASVVRPRVLEDAIAQADHLELFDLTTVRRVLDAHPRQHGAPALRALLGRLDGTDIADTRSGLEVALLQLCDDYNLPVPYVNHLVAGVTVDFFWPSARLVVETDGFRFHRTPTVFERDRDRDQLLLLAGYRVARFTYHQIVHRQRESARRLRVLLDVSGASGPQ